MQDRTDQRVESILGWIILKFTQLGYGLNVSETIYKAFYKVDLSSIIFDIKFGAILVSHLTKSSQGWRMG